MRATSYSVLAGFCEVKLELVVAGSRPLCLCPLCFVFVSRNRQASPGAWGWGCPVESRRANRARWRASSSLRR
jgi:hypothetical protein